MSVQASSPKDADQHTVMQVKIECLFCRMTQTHRCSSQYFEIEYVDMAAGN